MVHNWNSGYILLEIVKCALKILFIDIGAWNINLKYNFTRSKKLLIF